VTLTTTLVVPCHDEADRLDVAAFTSFIASHPSARLVLVNDGSRDRTLDVLQQIQKAAGERVEVLHCEQNGGKAEAVRRGMLFALSTDTDLLGYWDADLATPLEACWAFVDLLAERPGLDMVMGSRVLLLGRAIDRKAIRHYAGRVFATAASVTLDLPVYDTQCGAKMFRASPKLKSVFEQPFISSWVFDVELIARLGSNDSRYDPQPLRKQIYELPLLEWRDVEGSKVKWIDFIAAMFDLAKIRQTYIAGHRAV
jgi:glycosyltransferase involved in cell wall biosynthesis